MIGRDAARGFIIGLAAITLVAVPSSAPGAATALPSFGCDPLNGPQSAALSLSSSNPAADVPGAAAAYRRALRAGPQLRLAQPARATTPVRIPVHVHVIREDETVGNVSDEAIAQQLGVLNAGFAGTIAPGGENTGFVFDLVDTDRSNRPDDYPTFPGFDGELKQALREGGHRALNVYITDIGFPGIWGTSTSPDLPESDRVLDGVMIDNTTLPGGSAPDRNEGDTLTHEVGHWLGLFHTFEGGSCSPTNDLVEDTPAQAGQTAGCPAGADTCPELPGADPIHNFMDYSSDSCVHQFTPGQADRMHDQTAIYRNDPPQATAGPVQAASGKSQTVDVSATDPEGDVVSFRVVDAPDHGMVEGSGPSFAYRSEAGYSGSDSFTVEAADIFGATDQVEVPIAVRRDEAIDLRIRAKTKQKLRKLAIRAGCQGEACDLRAKARIRVNPSGRGKTRRFSSRTVRGSSAEGARTKLAFKLAKPKAEAVERLLADGASATAALTVQARDAAGNDDAGRITVVVK